MLVCGRHRVKSRFKIKENAEHDLILSKILNELITTECSNVYITIKYSQRNVSLAVLSVVWEIGASSNDTETR